MANTRITQGVIKPNEDYDVRHINATGIITATNLNLTGVLTYEDVTNVDSIGVITARKGIVSSGVVTASAFHGDGSALTGIDATALKDPAGNVKIQAQASGAMHTGFSTMQNLRVTGIATFGSGSTTINNNTINVGTALTLGHTQGVQFLTQNLHSEGFEVNQINASGIITASSFSGDGSNLTSLPAGLGTALSSTQSSPLNKIYYTNSVLPVESTITVDTPASASAAYTQYTDISLGSGADLIISDGDDLIPDVLGLRPDGTFGGGALGRMRVDKLVGKDANSAVNVEKGLVVTGVCTATSFSGDGSALTGLSGVSVANQADNRLITVTGTTDALNGEANLTFDGTVLSTDQIRYASGGNKYHGHPRSVVIGYSGSNYANLGMGWVPTSTNDQYTSANSDYQSRLELYDGLQIHGSGASVTSGQTVTWKKCADFKPSAIKLYSDGNERLRINSSGQVLINTSTAAAFSSRKLTVSDVTSGGTTAMEIRSATNGSGRLYFTDSTSSSDAGSYAGKVYYDHPTDHMAFYTGGSTNTPGERMKIDAYGRVTKTSQPFVMVHIQTTSNRNTTGSYLVVPWDIIHLKSTSSNVGNHFNTSTHRFTAPVDGRYLFVMSLNIVADNIVKHRINGADVSKGEYRDGNDNKWDHADASFIYDMNANDYYDCVSQLFGSGQRFNGGSNGVEGWDTLSIYLLG